MKGSGSGSTIVCVPSDEMVVVRVLSVLVHDTSICPKIAGRKRMRIRFISILG
jgi:hypothetical protein